ncbi:MAG: hypothetical protein LLF92_08195 [Planctomycetaceae bacterium]|nr:hypothetical protein [Planctomycetaceae bacterium]
MNCVKFFILFLVLSSFSPLAGAFQPPPPASATCRITCRVAEVIEWSEASFQDIDLGELSPKRTEAAGQSVLTLYTNGDVIITADNSETAKLSNGRYQIRTQYQLQCGSGTVSTQWCAYDTFLKEAVEIIHRQTDGAVVVILSVKAQTNDFRPGSGGEYAAVQTLTACWKS